MIDVKATLSESEERMEMAALFLEDSLNRIRAGRANVAILSGVRVNSYGQMVPLNLSVERQGIRLEAISGLAREKKVRILPVDSEHSAIFQSLNGERMNHIDKILLTASGGPFRGRTREQMKDIRLEDALKHPNWVMGHKITIDSSTMVNKGLEVMEARWLFDVDIDRIQVVVQPQSVIHSMVQFDDGAVIAQLGTPDMKLPIQYALYYPERRYLPGSRLDFASLGSITFEDPDPVNFPGLALAMQAGKRGGSLPTVFNAANERAVAMFLKKEIGYLQITEIIEAAMKAHSVVEDPDVDQILKAERETYAFIEENFRS